MTNNPREQAIEKLAIIFHEKSVSGYLTHEENKHIAALALDALNIEVVSKESEPKMNDHIIMPFPFDSFTITREFQIEDLIDEPCNYEISKRSNKPAVYVENIGVKL